MWISGGRHLQTRRHDTSVMSSTDEPKAEAKAEIEPGILAIALALARGAARAEFERLSAEKDRKTGHRHHSGDERGID